MNSISNAKVAIVAMAKFVTLGYKVCKAGIPFLLGKGGVMKFCEEEKATFPLRWKANLTLRNRRECPVR